MITKLMIHINSLEKGGAERVVATLADEFVKMGIDVILATEWTGKKEYEVDTRVRRINVGLTDEEESFDGKKKRNIRKERLRELIKEEKPDVVYAFCRNANYRAILAAKGTGVPVIFSVRSDPKIDYASKKHKFIGNTLYKMSAGGVFQTDEAMGFFSKKVQKKSAVIINPLNEKYLDIKMAAERRKAVVSVGRFHDAKDHMTLIKAMEIVLKKHPDYVLELYGDRSEDNTYDVITEYVKNNGLADKVLFMGNRNDLEERIVDASVFVLSSKYEGMPNALMEAMAMSLPVVSTDCPCGGPAFLIDEGINGILCKVGNPKEMAAAINKLIECPAQANEIAKKAGEITKIASPEIIAKQWLTFAESKV